MRSNSSKPSSFGDAAWLAIAAAFLLAAFIFWWRGMNDAAFVTSVLGIVAWFWRQRNRYRAIRIEAEDANKFYDEQQGELEIDRE